MDDRDPVLETAGLCFFSKMTAAYCHETKNALAIINENAGLLEDLVLMAAKGRPLDPERLQRLSANIRRQVARADQLAKESHRLAHSLDAPQGPSDLGQALELATALASRFAAMAEVAIEIDPGPAAVSLPVSTFKLLHLIWLAMEFALTGMHKGGCLGIAMEKSPPRAVLRLAPLALCDESQATRFITIPEVHSLVKALRCNIDFEPQAAQLLLYFEINGRTKGATHASAE
ncbi:MAG: hypothetical protein WBG37_12085 [Desulfobacterales bacterium]